ncbi:hypothetical protein BD779DRAFT_475827 [Infundibulicybe gibba]|nr:hypothetical protein BD779DRAFT_475827 [Infundibulicybe gibba]
MHTTKPIVLPQEVIDSALDHFHSNPVALKACALVCHAWLHTSRTHLFRKVSLQPPQVVAPRSTAKVPSDSQRLYTLLRSDPGIARYIQELVVCEGMVQREWIARDQGLLHILRALHNVSRFELKRSAAMPIVWDTLPIALREALGGILQLPSLNEVNLVGLVMKSPSALFGLLKECRNLRTLEVSHLAFPSATEPMSPESELEPSSRCGLDVLVIGPRTQPAFIDYMLRPGSRIDPSSTRELSTSISNAFPSFARLIQSATLTRRLEIILMNDINLRTYWDLPPHERLTLEHNAPFLQQLSIRADLTQNREDPLLWIQALLMIPSPFLSLHTISIVYTIYVPDPYINSPEVQPDFTAWAPIDALLTAEDAFPHLARVRLEFALENPLVSMWPRCSYGTSSSRRQCCVRRACYRLVLTIPVDDRCFRRWSMSSDSVPIVLILY